MPKKNPVDIILYTDHGDLYEVPRFTNYDRNYFFNLNETELEVLNHFREVHKKSYFILLLGYFKAKPVTLSVSWTMVKDDLKYIYQRYFSRVPVNRRNIKKDAKSDIYKKVLLLTGFQRFNNQHQVKLIEHATNSVSIKAQNKYVFDECITFLNQQWIALPAQSRIQNIVSNALSKEESRLTAIFNKQLKGEFKDYIFGLLAPQKTTEKFDTLRYQAKDFTYGELSRELRDKKELDELFIQATKIINLAAISDGNVKFYAELFQNYRTSQLKQFKPAKASIYITSYLRQRYTNINDNLTNGFYRCVKKYKQASKSFSDENIVKEAGRLGKQVKKVSDILYILSNYDNARDKIAKDLLEEVYAILPQQELTAVADFMSNVELDKKRFIWKYYADNETTIRRNLRRLFLALEFDIDKTQPILAAQVIVAKQELNKYGEIRTIDAALIRPVDLTYLQNDDKVDPKINPFLFECYLYHRLFNALDNDVCYIHNSYQFRPLNDYLVNKKEIKELGKAMSLPILDVPISGLALNLKAQLDEKMGNASKRIIDGNNGYVVYSDRTNKIKWSLSVKKDKPKVNNDLFEQFDQIGIIDLMRIVNQETNFFSEFTHFQPKYQRTEPNVDDILACILGNGTNFGLYKIASISDRSFNSLRTAQSGSVAS
ncbi:MAG: DUF4158 domain-containing protein [Alteromonadaceae bacterium]|nr:DUF4158 domain-containing protein [Alteromonadaceae bacterium]